MKVNDEVVEKMIKAIRAFIPSFHSHKRQARIYAKRFNNGFSDGDREFIIKEILHQQNRSIVKAISNRKNIAIPSIGSFQFRDSLEIIRGIKNEVKQKYGVEDVRKVDEETYNKINDEVQYLKRKIVLPLYIEQHGGKGSTVYHNFLTRGKENNLLRRKTS